jgi:hypothetical protein
LYGPHLCNEYIKGVDAFIDFVKIDMLDNNRGNLYWTTLEGIFIVLTNIVRMRRDIVQMMC